MMHDEGKSMPNSRSLPRRYFLTQSMCRPREGQSRSGPKHACINARLTLIEKSRCLHVKKDIAPVIDENGETP